MNFYDTIIIFILQHCEIEIQTLQQTVSKFASNASTSLVKNIEIDTLISKGLSVENKAKLSQLTRAYFVKNSEIDTLISKGLSVENKAKLSQLTRADFVTISKLTH